MSHVRSSGTVAEIARRSQVIINRRVPLYAHKHVQTGFMAEIVFYDTAKINLSQCFFGRRRRGCYHEIEEFYICPASKNIRRRFTSAATRRQNNAETRHTFDNRPNIAPRDCPRTAGESRRYATIKYW